MIVFKSIRYKNFLSSGNNWTEITLDNFGTTLILGKNGSGKSTLTDAITFALFGKAYRNINKPQLINSINQKDLLVELYLEIYGKKYKIVRGLKPSIFEIYLGDKLIDQDASIKDYQSNLETKILKMDYKSFCQLVILGSSTYIPFMQLSLADRRQIIEDLLGIEIFSKMNHIVKEDLSTLKDQITTLDHKIKITETEIEGYQRSQDSTHKLVNAEIQRHLDEKETLSTKLANSSELLERLYDARMDLLYRLGDLSQVKEKQKKIQKYRELIEVQLLDLGKKIELYTNNKECSSCFQSIDETFANRQLDQLNADKSKKVETLDSLSSKELELSNKIEKLSKIQVKIDELDTKINSLENSVSWLKFSIESSDRDIKRLKQSKQDSSVEDIKTLDALNETLQSFNKDLEKAKHKRRIYMIVANILKDNGVKGHIVDNYVTLINKYINNYLSKMGFFVDFVFDNTFKECIKSRHRDEFSYESFSEGEKLRIDLSILFTWREIAKLRNSLSTNLLILDEIMDSSLDEQGTEDFFDIIKLLSKECNIFVISHKGETILEKFDRMIRFTKDGNFSNKEEG